MFRVAIYSAEPIFPRYLTMNPPNSSYSIRKAESHAEVAATCLSYLSFRYFDGDITDDEVDGFIAAGGYVLHQYSQSNFLHHIRGAWRDEGGTSEVLRSSTKGFLKARWNPSFRHVDLETSSSSSTLEHIQPMDSEDYKKLRIIATHLRACNLTGSTKSPPLLFVPVFDC